MLKNITRREPKTDIFYEVSFMHDANGGFGFPCDKEGNLKPLHPDGQRNYEYCMAHPEKFSYEWNRIRRYEHHYIEPAHGDCICGRTVYLEDHYYGACQCDCGRWYNIYGQELLPPEQWEEDPSDEDYEW